ncbi:MAG TPA: endonuclease domain-containing protein [Xanthobacteraceae bacterium]|nr:endonuclease domain-containing protein [Xanthobacteraceae bacterium]
MELWQKLRNRQLCANFRRQHPIGPYILDFYCPALRLAIELDGGQHSEAEIFQHDARRTRWLCERNVTVLRFWNSDVAQYLSGVLETIVGAISELQSRKMTLTRRAARVDLPLSGGGEF